MSHYRHDRFSSEAGLLEVKRSRTPADQTSMEFDTLGAIEARVREARQIPLTGDVRLDPDDVRPLIQQLRAATRGTTAEKPSKKLEALILKGRKVPFVDQVRFSRRRALKLLGEVSSHFAAARM